jgi:hypothetical protein
VDIQRIVARLGQLPTCWPTLWKMRCAFICSCELPDRRRWCDVG